MAQRISGYERVSDEAYHTVLAWSVAALLQYLPDAAPAWDPCAADGDLVRNLNALGVETVGTTDDFLARREPPPGIRAPITNPPYGPKGQCELAVAFARHALALKIPIIALLLAVDFDSAITRQDIFRHCPFFHAKITL